VLTSIFLSSGADLKCYVWDANSPYSCLSVYSPAEEEGMFATLSVGKDYILTGEWDGMLRVWPLYNKKKPPVCFVPFTEKRSKHVKRAPKVVLQDKPQKRQPKKNMQQQQLPPKQQQMQQQKTPPNNFQQQQQMQQQQQQQQQPGPGGQNVQYVSVQCPPNAQPGQKLHISHNGKTYEVSVPNGIAPGQTFQLPVAI
jgi:hypothetical protein